MSKYRILLRLAQLFEKENQLFWMYLKEMFWFILFEPIKVSYNFIFFGKLKILPLQNLFHLIKSFALCGARSGAQAP